jgi:hypothetical protein
VADVVGSYPFPRSRIRTSRRVWFAAWTDL